MVDVVNSSLPGYPLEGLLKVLISVKTARPGQRRSGPSPGGEEVLLIWSDWTQPTSTLDVELCHDSPLAKFQVSSCWSSTRWTCIGGSSPMPSSIVYNSTLTSINSPAAAAAANLLGMGGMEVFRGASCMLGALAIGGGGSSCN